jgi:hypothetical protein
MHVVEDSTASHEYGKVPSLSTQMAGTRQGALMTILSSSRIRWFALLLTIILVSVTYLVSAPGKVQVNAEALQMFAPLPVVMTSPDNPVTDAKVTLGRILYYDPRLSANQKISCNTCHPLDAYGAQSTSVSTGFKHQQGKRNAPTVYNAAGILYSSGTAGLPLSKSKQKARSRIPLRWRCPRMPRPWK